jgi:hypothetical protein
MLPRERVIEVIEHRHPDRMPVYAWVRANLEAQISAQFGSVEAFEDHYEFDYAHLFPGRKGEPVPKPVAKDGVLYHFYCAVAPAPDRHQGEIEHHEVRGISLATK